MNQQEMFEVAQEDRIKAKDEALKLAIAEIEGWIDHAYGHTPKECADNKAIKACKKALEL